MPVLDPDQLIEESPLWVRALYYVGLPTFFALVMLGMLIGWVPSPIASTNQMMVEHIKSDETNVALLRLICIQTAKNDSEKDACILAGSNVRRDTSSQ